jgi:tRNA-splicing ligase RtcB
MMPMWACAVSAQPQRKPLNRRPLRWGYGFPIGGVAAFDPDQGGVVSAGGVGFDISCGVRTLVSGLEVNDILRVQNSLAQSLFRQIPAGVGSTGAIVLDAIETEAMLTGGARWAIERGWGEERDLDRIEEGGLMYDARPEFVSERAKERQRQPRFSTLEWPMLLL